MDKVRIASRGESFRRAGIGFTREGQIFGPGELSPEQVEVLAKEPNLIITPVREDAEAGDGTAEGDAKPKAKR